MTSLAPSCESTTCTSGSVVTSHLVGPDNSRGSSGCIENRAFASPSMSAVMSSGPRLTDAPPIESRISLWLGLSIFTFMPLSLFAKCKYENSHRSSKGRDAQSTRAHLMHRSHANIAQAALVIPNEARIQPE